MVDERRNVIERLIRELHRLGISPDEPFYVDFIPGEPPRFHSDGSASSSSSSAETGVANGPKVLSR